jgi:hypothetical protein
MKELAINILRQGESLPDYESVNNGESIVSNLGGDSYSISSQLDDIKIYENTKIGP